MGFWVPHITVLLWMTSAVMSLFIYVFLLENVLRLIYNSTTKRTDRVKQIIVQIKPALEYMDAQRVILLNKFGFNSMRAKYEQLYKRLSDSKIKELKYWTLIRMELLDIVTDVIMITIYVVVLYIVILEDRDTMNDEYKRCALQRKRNRQLYQEDANILPAVSPVVWKICDRRSRHDNRQQ
ncbi:hypothetical protein JTB14_014493 [Gonioctena quinquepunctata]|nr:hypothetical protein JTB14_014493 [Gonioctena quinquepunctata]